VYVYAYLYLFTHARALECVLYAYMCSSVLLRVFMSVESVYAFKCFAVCFHVFN
jgi:hypothetical protein